MAKKEKKKGKAGKTVAGAGILAVIAALLGFDPFGWGIGLGMGTGTGTGTGTGDGGVKQEQQNDDYLMQDDQVPTVLPAATATPIVEQQEENPVAQITELAVTVSGNKVVYNGAESTAQELADKLAADYADTLSNILVKVTLDGAVYNTVDELKAALEGKGITYKIAE